MNTNSAYLSEKCAELGLSVYYQTVVGDNETRMRETIQTALDRSDIVILTGGLGPTEDDLTKEVTAEVMGMQLVEDRHSQETDGSISRSSIRKTTHSARSQLTTTSRQWSRRVRSFSITTTAPHRD